MDALAEGPGGGRGARGTHPLSDTRTEAQRKGGEVARLNAVYVGASLDAPVVQGQGLPVGVRLGYRRALGRFGLRGELGYTDGAGALGSGQQLRVQSVAADLAGLYRVLDSLVWVDVGVQLGGAVHFEGVGAAGYWGLSGLGAATAAVGLALGRVGPQLLLTGGARLMRLDGATKVRPHLSASLGLVVEL